MGFANKYTRKTGFQLERGEVAEKLHIQCFFAFRKRLTQKQALGLVGGFIGEGYLVHIKPRAGTMQEALSYCQKDDTRVEGTNSFLFPDPTGLHYEYRGDDIVDIPTASDPMYQWQKNYLDFLFGDKLKEYRMVYVLTDSMLGGTGKSSLIKYILFKKQNILYLPVVDSPSQTTSAILNYMEQNNTNPPTHVIFDIARGAPISDIQKVFYLAEQVRSGVVVSSFYGKYKRKIFTPPEVLITTNHKFYQQDLNNWAPINRFLIENITPSYKLKDVDKKGNVSVSKYVLSLITEAPYRKNPQ